MYARVGIITESHANALVVPTNALVDANGTRGVYLAINNVASFPSGEGRHRSNARTEILDGAPKAIASSRRVRRRLAQRRSDRPRGWRRRWRRCRGGGRGARGGQNP